MPNYYPDFSGLNDAVKAASIGARNQALIQALNSLRSIPGIAAKVPGDWARAYAGVMVLKYSQDGTPTDVTPDVTGSGITVPNAVLSKAINDVSDLIDQAEDYRSVWSPSDMEYAGKMNMNTLKIVPAESVLAVIPYYDDSSKRLLLCTNRGSVYFKVGDASAVVDSTAMLFSTYTDDPKNAVGHYEIISLMYRYDSDRMCAIRGTIEVQSGGYSFNMQRVIWTGPGSQIYTQTVTGPYRSYPTTTDGVVWVATSSQNYVSLPDIQVTVPGDHFVAEAFDNFHAVLDELNSLASN